MAAWREPLIGQQHVTQVVQPARTHHAPPGAGREVGEQAMVRHGAHRFHLHGPHHELAGGRERGAVMGGAGRVRVAARRRAVDHQPVATTAAAERVGTFKALLVLQHKAHLGVVDQLEGRIVQLGLQLDGFLVVEHVGMLHAETVGR